jgi:hypothetical protein
MEGKLEVYNIEEECSWPLWVEELFDNDEKIVDTKNFSWKFLEDNPKDDDIEYA